MFKHPLILTSLSFAFLSPSTVYSQAPAPVSEVVPAATGSEDLPRRGTLGLGIDALNKITVLRPGGPADRAGLIVGDTLLSLDEKMVISQQLLVDLLRTLPGGKIVSVRYEREGKEETGKITLDPVPSETVEGSNVFYSSVTTPAGYRLRSIITEPINSPLAIDGKVPAFLYVQGIYCASLDRAQAPDAVDTRLVHAIAKAGYVTMRVDKPGLGDSQGPPCSEIDFDTELAGFVAALKDLRSRPGVDPQRIYILGHSMGGVLAPYLSKEVPVKGTAVYGTLARTWFEYQLENTRRQMKLGGQGEVETARAVQAEARSSAMILIDKKTVGDVWERYPELRQPVSPMIDENHMASRHVKFYHQLQELNLAQAWLESTGALLAIHGEYDWVTNVTDHEMLVDIVNSRTPNGATLLTMPKADHAFTTHDSLQESLAAMGQGEWDATLPTKILEWVDTLEGRTARKAEAEQKSEATQSSVAQQAEGPTVARAETATTSKEQAAEPKLTFPASWVGNWKGKGVTEGSWGGNTYDMELRISPTDAPQRFNWVIVYDGKQGKQTRNYTLVVKEAAKGEYAIDEANGIVLDARYLDGGVYTHFSVEGARSTSVDRLLGAGTADERIETEIVTVLDDKSTATGGKGQSPEVKTWSPIAVQRAVLRREGGAQAAAPAVPAPAQVSSSGQAPASSSPSSSAPAPLETGARWSMLDTEKYPGKQDDIFFINSSTGWYVNGAGKIFKTTDGGDTWTMKVHKPGTYFRCITFVDANLGFAGNIGPGYFPNVTDEHALYTTTDGGETWAPITNIPGGKVIGLCALEVVREEFINAGTLATAVRIVGVGRVGGPATLIHSDDLGATWTQTDISKHTAMAFDVHFFNRREGIIAGCTDADVSQSRARILTTSDGGQTWTTAYESSRPYELTWKISFPDRQNGYVTLQSYNPDKAASQRFVAKTTDGGKTYTEIPLIDNHAVRQFGVAFITPSRGWIGAAPHGFETTDGGATWKKATFGNAVNKIRVLREAEKTVLHAIGVDVARLEVR